MQVALLNSTGEVTYRAELTIMKLVEADEKNEYHLVKNIILFHEYSKLDHFTIEHDSPQW
jgi:hypothetical protein